MCVCLTCLVAWTVRDLSLSLCLSLSLTLWDFSIFSTAYERFCNSPNMLFHWTRCASNVRFVSFRRVESLAADVTRKTTINQPGQNTDKPLQMKNGKYYTITEGMYKNTQSNPWQKWNLIMHLSG